MVWRIADTVVVLRSIDVFSNVCGVLKAPDVVPLGGPVLADSEGSSEGVTVCVYVIEEVEMREVRDVLYEDQDAIVRLGSPVL